MLPDTNANRDAVSVDNVDHAIRETSLLHKFPQTQCRAWCQLTGLDNRRAACGERKGQLLANDEQREVPGSDHPDNADRLTENEAEHLAAQGIVRFAVDVACERGGILPQSRRALHLVSRLTDRLAT